MIPEEAYAGYRIVELGSGVAGAYCGKLFADFGAEVIVLEPAIGGAFRRHFPLVDKNDDRSDSAYGAWLSTNKDSVLLDDATSLKIIAGADLLIDSRPPDVIENSTVSHDALLQMNERLVIIALSWFGENGPYRNFNGTDTVCRALAGLIRLVGPASGPPLAAHGHIAEIVGGLTSFIAASAKLFRPDVRDRRISVSLHEANIMLAECNFAHRARPQLPKHRLGVNRFAPTYPLGIFECEQGWIGVTILTPEQWRSLCSLLDLQELAEDPKYSTSLGRLAQAELLEPILIERFRQKPASEWFQHGLRYKLPFVVVPGIKQLLEDPDYRYRSPFGTVQIGEYKFEAPILPQRLELTKPKAAGVAPKLGNRNAGDISTPAPNHPPLFRSSKISSTDHDLPLAGISIIDLSMGWAGPLATRHMADLGAEVIKVEACQYPDWWRGVEWTAEAITARLYETNMQFLMLNRNKQGITLDLTTPEGAALLKRLVREADAVVENFSVGVLPKLGLDYESLRKENENLVMLSMPAFGSTGRWKDCRAYGSTLEQASGLPSVTGEDKWPPTMNHLAFGDPIGGLNGAAALLIALFHKQRSGQGQNIDLSQVECVFPFLAHSIIDQSINGSLPPRIGSRHPQHVPHGCFPCQGDDEWIVIAVTDETQWLSLSEVLGRTNWKSSDFSDVNKRRARESEIEIALSSWTSSRSADSAMIKLQAAGISAGAVRSPFELLDEPQLVARKFWQEVTRDVIGNHIQSSPVFRTSGPPLPVRSPAPLLGEHNDAVLRQKLGLTDADLMRLNATEIIGRVAAPRSRSRTNLPAA